MVSPSNDPFFNLALEDVLLRHYLDHPQQVILLLYRNNPCVVLGNFQCPWKEIPLGEYRQRGFSIARRQSGGGTVYHDLGNLNFSFVFPKSLGQKNHLNFIWKEYFANKGLSIASSGRDDFGVLRTETTQEVYYKFSGQAFKQTKDGILHHGTLLFNGDLAALNAICFPNQAIESKAVDSVVSKVTNLKEHLKDLANAEEFILDICQFMRQAYSAKEWDIQAILEDPVASGHLNQKLADLNLWSHVFGKTPKFFIPVKLMGQQLLLKIEKGRVVEILDAEEKLPMTQLSFMLNLSLAPEEFDQAIGALDTSIRNQFDLMFTELKDQLIFL